MAVSLASSRLSHNLATYARVIIGGSSQQLLLELSGVLSQLLSQVWLAVCGGGLRDQLN